jgi:hypothetical protein
MMRFHRLLLVYCEPSLFGSEIELRQQEVAAWWLLLTGVVKAPMCTHLAIEQSLSSISGANARGSSPIASSSATHLFSRRYSPKRNREDGRKKQTPSSVSLPLPGGTLTFAADLSFESSMQRLILIGESLKVAKT